MASEADIRGAERARLVAVVGEHGTEGERVQLEFWVALGRAEVPLDPEVIVRLARRVERRTRFVLPVVSCAVDPPTRYCSCLERALEEPGSRGKRAVLKRAAEFHWSLPARRERLLAVEGSTVPAEGSPPAPGPERIAPRRDPPAKPDPTFRVVKRTPKWFDRENNIRDMRF